MKKVLTIAFMMCCAEMVMAQKIDFNMYNANSAQAELYTANGYTPWIIAKGATIATQSFEDVTITIEPDNSTAAKKLNSVQWLQGRSENALICDGVTAKGYDENDPGGVPNITSGKVSIKFTISGLSIGKHSILAYHNDGDDKHFYDENGEPNEALNATMEEAGSGNADAMNVAYTRENIDGKDYYYYLAEGITQETVDYIDGIAASHGFTFDGKNTADEARKAYEQKLGVEEMCLNTKEPEWKTLTR